MEVQIRSDGQLYPPRKQELPKPPPPKPTPPPCAPPHPPSQDLPWEDLLLIGIALLVLKNKDRPDIPLLLALAYILFDRQFDLKQWLNIADKPNK